MMGPSQDDLRRLFDYHPDGYLVWKIRRRGRSRKGARAGTLCVKSRGSRMYWSIGVDGKRHLAHRLIWAWHFGVIPNIQIDHINNDPGDNRIENLRLATASQNMANRDVLSTNTSGYRGVVWIDEKKKWRANISSEYLGYFSDPTCAAKAYDKAAIERWGKFARLNFPEG